MEKGKMKAFVADRLLFRHWDSWEDGKRTHILLMDLALPKAPCATSRRATSTPPPSSWAAGRLRRLPDGKELVFTSNREAQPATSTNSDLWTAPIDGSPEALAAPRNITAANRASDGSPRYSPDGRFIAYTMQRVPGYESDRIVLALHDRAAGTSRVVTEAFDDWVRAFRFAPDGRRIWFTADVKGRTPLHALDLATGSTTAVSSVGQVDAFEVAPTARGRSWRAGGCTADGARPRGPPRRDRGPLTNLNQALLDEVDFRPMEEVFVDSPSGGRSRCCSSSRTGSTPGRSTRRS